MAYPLASDLFDKSVRSLVNAEVGRFKPPSPALADIGPCLDGIPNFLIDFPQKRGECPTALLYAPKISAVLLESQSYRKHWQYACSSDIIVIASEFADLHRRAGWPCTRRDTAHGGKIAVVPSELCSRSDGDAIAEGPGWRNGSEFERRGEIRGRRRRRRSRRRGSIWRRGYSESPTSSDGSQDCIRTREDIRRRKTLFLIIFKSG